MLKNIVAIMIFAVAIVGANVLTASAQTGTTVTKRVRFARGTDSAVFNGRAARGTSYVYVVRARAGQAMSVELTGIPGAIILPPRSRIADAPRLEEGEGEGKLWGGDLMLTGDYKIIVSQTTRRANPAPYTLKITIQ